LSWPPTNQLGSDQLRREIRTANATPISRSAEELIQQLVTAYAEVLGYIGENPRQSTHAKRCVIRDRDVVLAALLRRETHMAPVLARDLIPKRAEGTRKTPPVQIAWELHDRLMPR
jgi:histone H3/H4